MRYHDDEVPEMCPDCGHVHTGPEFGQICIGCDCLSVPAIVGRNPPRPPQRAWLT